MDRNKLFNEFLEECKKNKQICGAGNPYAQILLVGQEHYAKYQIKEDKDKEWEDYLNRYYEYCSIENNPWIKNDENDNRWRDFQNSSPTWRNYQQLINEALPNRLNRSTKGIRDFEFDAFSTELNSIPRPHKTLDSQTKDNVKKRLALFKGSQFIQSFPVILLACGDYISNQGEGADRQIDNAFDVEFDDELNEKGVPKGWHEREKGKLWFTTHHSKDKQKLVIHTRQFSLRYTNKEDREWLIKKMADVIRGHLDHLKNLD